MSVLTGYQAFTALHLLISKQQPACCVGCAGRRVPAQVTPSGIIFSQRVKDLAELKDDDEAAQAEAQAQVGAGVMRESPRFRSHVFAVRD